MEEIEQNMEEKEQKSRFALYIFATLIVIVLVVIIAVAVQHPVNTVPVATNTTSTIVAYLHLPSIAGAKLISSSQAPLIQQLESNVTGSYLATYSFTNNSNETLIIRVLRYSNNNSAYNAYLYITNYTFNSTAISMPSLPPGYAGVYITSQPGMLYSITAHNGIYTVSVTLIGSNKSLASARSYLEQIIAAALQQA
jgi:hypothetical protein